MTNQITGISKGCIYNTQVPLSIIKAVLNKRKLLRNQCNRQLSSLRLFNKRIASELENRLITAQEPSSSYVTTMCGSVCCNMIATRYSYKVVSTSPSVYANLYRSLASLSMAVTK